LLGKKFEKALGRGGGNRDLHDWVRTMIWLCLMDDRLNGLVVETALGGSARGPVRVVLERGRGNHKRSAENYLR
jgi:hypothetical protein